MELAEKSSLLGSASNLFFPPLTPRVLILKLREPFPNAVPKVTTLNVVFYQVACYTPSSSQWTTVRPLHAGHGEPGIAVLGHRIYVLGGRSHNRGICMDYVHIYDAERDCWEEGPQLEEDISGMAACILTLPRVILTEGEMGMSDGQCKRVQDYSGVSAEVLRILDWEEFESMNDN